MENEIKNNRNYGIDALRIVLIFMVCILHVWGQGGVSAACVETNRIGFFSYGILSSVSCCAVNGFGLISGYMENGKRKKYEKLVDMWFQIFFYSFILTMMFIIVGMYTDWGLGSLLSCAFPLTFNYYWYFTAFFITFLASSLVYPFIAGISENNARKVLIVIFFLFTMLNLVKDTFCTEWGYSPIWLILLYIIGGLMRKIHIFEKKNTKVLWILWLVCNILLWILCMVLRIDRFAGYTSPLVLFDAMLLVVLFERIPLKGNLITKVSPYVFGIYLFQLNKVVYGRIIKDAFGFVATKPIPIGFVYILLGAATIFIVGLFVEIIRVKLFKLLKVSIVSKKIIFGIQGILNKAEILLG